jgi:hypothetical protein
MEIGASSVPFLNSPRVGTKSKLIAQTDSDQVRKGGLLQKLNSISLEKVKIPGTRCLVAALFCASAAFVIASDFKSQILQANETLTITVRGDRFLKIQNFTQEAPATSRGFVSVTTNSLTANVLTAAIIDPMATPGSLEVINSVVIAGPASVRVTCGDSSCFISYRKDSG